MRSGLLLLTVRRVNWMPTKHTRMCGEHFVTKAAKHRKATVDL